MPDRIVADKVVLARPEADEAIVLGGPAALVWVALDRWTTLSRVQRELREAHPELADDEAEAVVERSVRMLDDEGLLERRRD